MALIKTVETDFGIPATYWNIGAVQEDFKAGKQPLAAGKAQITGEEYVAGADRAALYAVIKQRPEFEGAEDA